MSFSMSARGNASASIHNIVGIQRPIVGSGIRKSEETNQYVREIRFTSIEREDVVVNTDITLFATRVRSAKNNLRTKGEQLLLSLLGTAAEEPGGLAELFADYGSNDLDGVIKVLQELAADDDVQAQIAQLWGVTA